MNKIFYKSYIIPSLELTLDYIVLNYSFLDTTCFYLCYGVYDIFSCCYYLTPFFYFSILLHVILLVTLLGL